MSSRHPDGPEALVGPLYFVALLLVATPTMDFVTSVLPFRLGSIEWRFASVGLLSGFLLTPLLGMVLAMGVAQMASHLRFQRVVAVVGLTVTVLFAALFVLFVLDIFQLQSVVQEEARDAFSSAAQKAAIKHLCFLVALGWLSYGAIRVSRWSVPEPKRRPAAVVIG